MPKLIWSRLKKMCCPKCGSTINKPILSTDRYSCQNFMCDFTIGQPKFDEIVGGMYKTPRTPRFEDPDSRLSELNNLGREIEDENYKQPDN